MTYQQPDDSPTGGDWEEVTAERHVRCSLEDVKHDDLERSRYDEQVPRGQWTSIEADRADRCGDDFETLLWRLGNCEREKRKMAPLACDLRLVWASRAHAADMAARGYFDHHTPEGVDPFERMQARGMTFTRAAENLAFAPTMGIAHRGWMSSQGHRKNILNEAFTHGGVGVIRTGEGYLLTALFLTP
jgi:uncharacterized protein YkwD